MASQLDLDQGGTTRQWDRVWMGPSIGYAWRPQRNVLLITTAGTYTIDYSTSLVEVHANGSVTINLPSCLDPTVPAIATQGPFVRNPITIADTGGFAGSFPITILPASSPPNQFIIGLSQIQITVNYGAYVLTPSTIESGWSSL